MIELFNEQLSYYYLLPHLYYFYHLFKSLISIIFNIYFSVNKIILNIKFDRDYSNSNINALTKEFDTQISERVK